MLSLYASETISTTRLPAMVDGKRGNPTTHLTSVKVTPLMVPGGIGQREIRAAIGLEGTAVQVFAVYCEAHAHVDGGSNVDQLPDIEVGDRLVYGSDTYTVRWTEVLAATTSFGQTRVMYVTEDKRA